MRHALFVTSVGLAALSLIACGLGIEGMRIDGVAAEAGGPDASLPPPGVPDDAEADGDAELGDADASTSDARVADADAADAGPCSDPSLVLCMRFENNLVDEAHGQTATTAGTFTYAAGKSGQAVVLGSGNSIHFNDGPAWTYTKLTVEAWVRPDAIPTGTARAGILDKDSSFGVFLYAGGQISCTMAGSVAANVATQGQWVHIACVNDGSTTKLYADGIEKVSVSATTLGMTTAVAAVGGNSPSGDPLTGALDTFRVYARALTAAEIAAAATP